MKRILITGMNSYVGNSVKDWLEKYPEQYEVDRISLRTDEWKSHDLSKYDVVFHVAGIAHAKETKKNKDLYYRVNRDLTFELAIKSKSSGVRQFIFLSSMSIYGIDNGVINNNTQPHPKSNYGKSKFQAENLLISLESKVFSVAILRPPMIYGNGCKGNYNRLLKLIKMTPVFPDIHNRRSMIHINNLSEFIRLIITYEESGLYCPQNKEFVIVREIVKINAVKYNKRVRFISIINPAINKVGKYTNVINKIFGDLVYDLELSKYHKEYCVIDFKDSIK